MFNQYHRNIVDVNLQYLYRQKKKWYYFIDTTND